MLQGDVVWLTSEHLAQIRLVKMRLNRLVSDMYHTTTGGATDPALASFLLACAEDLESATFHAQQQVDPPVDNQEGA